MAVDASTPKPAFADLAFSRATSYIANTGTSIVLGAMAGLTWRALCKEPYIKDAFGKFAYPSFGPVHGAIFFGSLTAVNELTRPALDKIFTKIFPPETFKLPTSRAGIASLKYATNVTASLSLTYGVCHILGDQFGIKFPTYQQIGNEFWERTVTAIESADFYQAYTVFSYTAITAIAVSTFFAFYELYHNSQTTSEDPKVPNEK